MIPPQASTALDPGDEIVTRWFSVEPLRHLLELRRGRGFGINAVAAAAGIERRQLQRLLARRRLRSDAADAIAVALGRHPVELWPDWFGDNA
jgi:lambda repressor-like predicted transcriptional regulator